MPEEKPAPGQKVAGSVIRSAAFVGDLVDMRTRFKSGSLDAHGRGKEIVPLGTDLVMVKNSSGADRERGECLQLGDFLLTTDEETENKWNLWFKGEQPSAPLWKCVILAQPAKHNADESRCAIVEAHCSGVCVAKVDVLDLTHTHATPVAGSCILDSAGIGPLELFSQPTEEGEQLLAVRFSGSSSPICEATLDDDLPYNDSATVTVFKGTGPGPEDLVTTGMLRDGYKLVTGNTVVVALIGDEWRAIQSKECPVLI